MKAKLSDLNYGVVIEKKHILHPRKYLEPYSLDLLEPVDGIGTIQFTCPTLGETLRAFESALKRNQPGTPAYLNAAYRNRIEASCDPAPSKEQMDRMAGVDHDAIMSVVNTGLTPNGKRPYRVKDDYVGMVIMKAVTRLHYMQDRKVAEQRVPSSREENPLAMEANLVWLTTRFGDLREEMFEDRDVEWETFLNLPWSDFVILQSAVNDRDYMEISEILDGRVNLDGKPVPFQGVPSGDEPEDAPKGSRKRNLPS